MGYNKQSNQPAFTIVELLVVIVVIGILAAITFVAYTGISSKATVASLTSDLDNAAKQLKLDQVSNMAYPTSIATANGGNGIKYNSDTTPQYVVNNNITPQAFCLSYTKSNQTFKITESNTTSSGDCTNYLPVLYLDAGTYSAGTTWTDLSGLGNNANLLGGVFKENDYLVCNGTDGGNDDYIEIPNSAASSYFNNPDNLTIMIVAQINRESGLFGPTDSNVYGHIIGKGGGDGSQTIKNAYSIFYDSRNNFMSNGFYKGTPSTQYPNNISGYRYEVNWADVQTANNWGDKFIAYFVISNDGKVSYYWYRLGKSTISGTATYTTGGTFDNIYNLRICVDYSSRYNKQRTWMAVVYDRALTSTEVNQNFASLRGRFGI